MIATPEEVLEAMARAVWEVWPERTPMPWHNRREEMKEETRKEIRAALRAARDLGWRMVPCGHLDTLLEYAANQLGNDAGADEMADEIRARRALRELRKVAAPDLLEEK